MKNSIIDRIPKFARALIVLAFWVVIWHIAALCVNKPVLVASPADTVKRLAQLICEKEFYVTILYSILRILAGFFSAVAVGSVLGVLTAKVRLIDEIVSPLLSVVRSTPVASFIIIALVWMNKQTIPSFISFLMVVPIIHGNVSEGLKSTPTELIEMTEVYGFSFRHRLTKLYFPSVFPYFLAGFRTSLGLAWKSGIAAEVLSFPKNSIGKELYEAKTYLETVDVFAWTLTIILISMVIEKILTHWVKMLSDRKKRESKK